ncbi:MAG: hypothetical protein ACP5RD_06450 [bacterium]
MINNLNDSYGNFNYISSKSLISNINLSTINYNLVTEVSNRNILSNLNLRIQYQELLINYYNQALGTNNTILAFDNSLIFTNDLNELNLILRILLYLLLLQINNNNLNSDNNLSNNNLSNYNFANYETNYETNVKSNDNATNSNIYDNSNQNYIDYSPYISNEAKTNNTKKSDEKNASNTNTGISADRNRTTNNTRSNITRSNSKQNTVQSNTKSNSNKSNVKNNSSVSDETYYHGKRTKLKDNKYQDKDNFEQDILFKRGNSFTSWGIDTKNLIPKEEIEDDQFSTKSQVKVKGTRQYEMGNNSGIKAEVEGYAEVGYEGAFDVSTGKTQRIDKDGNEYIVYKEGAKVGFNVGASAGASLSLSVYNGYDSITGTIGISKGLGIGDIHELQRGAALNTNTWLLEFFGSFGFGILELISDAIGNKLEKLGKIGKFLSKGKEIFDNISNIADFDITLGLKGKVQLQQVANESKQELNQEAQNILKSELKELQNQFINELKGKNVDKQTIETKKKKLEQEKNKLQKKALQKAWNNKQYQIKQRLKTEAKNRTHTIIYKFADNVKNRIHIIVNIIFRDLPPHVRETIYRALLGSEQLHNLFLNTINNALFVAFSKPIENVINNITLQDFTKKS